MVINEIKHEPVCYALFSRNEKKLYKRTILNLTSFLHVFIQSPTGSLVSLKIIVTVLKLKLVI